MAETFDIFEKKIDCDVFLNQLNSLHPSLTCTHEKEIEGKLPFLDVLVEKSNKRFLTSAYGKPTFTEQYDVEIHSNQKVEKPI